MIGYKVYWNDGSGVPNKLLESELDVVTEYSTSPTKTDLTDGADYRFKIVAFNAVGDGAFSD